MSLMQGQLSEARFALVLVGEGLSFANIEAKLGLKATRMIHKGDVVNKLPEVVAEKDEWVFGIPLTDPLGCDPELDQLLLYLCDKKEQLDELDHGCKIILRMYVQSDYAHMNYRLHPETVRMLCELGRGLDISSLSWGETGL